RRGGATLRHRERDRQAGRPSFGVDGLRRPFPRRGRRVRLRLGRAPDTDAAFDYGWEERWIRDEGYSKIVPPAIKATLSACKLKGSDITHFIMPSPMPAVPKQMAKMCGVAEGAVRDLLGANLGDTGCAHALVMLVDALETAKAG